MPLSRLRMVGPTRTLAATVWLFSVLAASAARADCAGGDGVISSPGVCATPEPHRSDRYDRERCDAFDGTCWCRVHRFRHQLDGNQRGHSNKLGTGSLLDKRA